MAILVTGARGTVGSVLCERIAQGGDVAVAWDRQQTPAGDEGAARALIGSVQPSAIIHTAMPSQSTGMPNEGWIVNEKWTADIARVAGEMQIPFVYTSTVMVYSNRAVGPFTPDMHPDESDGYGFSKRLGERAALEANGDSRIVRLGWQIGKAAGSNNMIDFLEKKFAEHGEIAASTRWMPGTSLLEDTADALIAISKMQPGTYHVGSNHEWNFYEIVMALNEVHGGRWNVTPNQDFVYDQRLLDPRVPIAKLEVRLPLKHL